MLKPAEKYMLTVQEASGYFEIGEKKLRQLITYNPELVTMNGTKVLINRRKFEKFLDNTESI